MKLQDNVAIADVGMMSKMIFYPEIELAEVAIQIGRVVHV